MADELLAAGLTLIFALVFNWGFRTLPGEKWQILASLPKHRNEKGQWQGENLTYYGLFNAHAYTFAVMTYIVLLGSLNTPISLILLSVCWLLSICIPASKIIARMVEKKKYTFTVGGASFAGILAAPFVVWAVNATLGNQSGFHMQTIPFLAVLCISYAFGEGIGRLACISFGCCYGKKLSECHPAVQKIFDKCCFVFTGSTKKIAYASAMEGEKVLPIQAVTAVLYTLSGIAGLYLFLRGFYTAAFLQSLLITQIWRCVSECFRADYRGEGRISAYQIMGILAAVYGIVLCVLSGDSQFQPADVLHGLAYLWDPAMIFFLQALWVGVFLYTGRSKVTGSVLSFHVVRSNI
ncbi:MAG: prolipoprotein diacylglyceryl transferase family protein [Desulfococcaceae bacterium]